MIWNMYEFRISPDQIPNFIVWSQSWQKHQKKLIFRTIELCKVYSQEVRMHLHQLKHKYVRIKHAMDLLLKSQPLNFEAFFQFQRTPHIWELPIWHLRTNSSERIMLKFKKEGKTNASFHDAVFISIYKFPKCFSYFQNLFLINNGHYITSKETSTANDQHHRGRWFRIASLRKWRASISFQI